MCFSFERNDEVNVYSLVEKCAWFMHLLIDTLVHEHDILAAIAPLMQSLSLSLSLLFISMIV